MQMLATEKTNCKHMEPETRTIHTDSGILSNDTDVWKLYYPTPRGGQTKEWKWDEEIQELCVFDTQVTGEEHIGLQAGSPKTVVTSSDPPNQESCVDVKNLDRSTIEVQGLSALNCEEMCRSYFENFAQSRGGHISHCSVNEDTKIVFITFESWKDTERVTRMPHVINGHNVIVRQCTSSHTTYPNMLLLKNVGEHTTKDQVSNYMENITGQEPREIIFGEQRGTVIVKFDEHINYQLLKRPCETIKLQGCQLSVSEVLISNCVLVKNLAPGTTEKDLVDYFENMSNVGYLEGVEMMPSENKCLVYFEDTEVIDYVLTQIHTIKGGKLSLQHYFEIRTDQTCPFVKPKCLCMKNIDQDKLAFIKLSTKARDELSHQLLSLYAKLEFVDDTLNVECTLTSSVPMAYALATTWSHYVYLTVKKYMNDLEVYKMKTLSIVWGEAVKAVNGMKQSIPDVAVVSLKMQENVIVVVGKGGTRNLFQQIVSIVENIEMEMERKNIKVRETDQSFQDCQLRLLQAVSFSAKVRTQYKDLSLDICITKREVTLTGQFKDVKEVLVEMVKFLQLVKHCTVNDLSSTFRPILRSTETFGLLVEKFRDEPVTAVWEEEKDNIVVYAFSDKELLKAVIIIRELVVQHVFCLKRVQYKRQLFKSDEWRGFALKLMNTHSGKLNLSYSESAETVLITATLTSDILDIVKANVGHFLSNNVFSEEYSISPCRHKFISLFWKDKVAGMADSLKEHKVEVTLTEDIVGMVRAKGTLNGLSLLWKKLQALTDQIVCHVTTVDDHLKVKFLTTEDCAKQMDIFERSSQCILGMNEEPNVIQVLRSNSTNEKHTAPSSSTGPGKANSRAGANQTAQRKLHATKLEVLDGNIATQQVDVIVNSTRHDLDLNNGGVSAAIFAIGGQGLQNECRAKYPKGIQTQDIARTRGHGLPCKEVFHVALCPFQTPNAEQILESVVAQCLTEANHCRYTSIAFPALGTGLLGYPSDIVSNTMLRAIDSFLTSTPAITLTSITVVIFNDKAISKDFRSVFSNQGLQTVCTPERRDSCGRPSHLDTSHQKAFKAETYWSGYVECAIGDLHLVIKPGDITEENADAIVNSTTDNMDLNGAVSTSLRTKYGAAFVEECQNKVAVTEIRKKGVCVTNSFSLRSKVILHISTNRFHADRLSEGIETLLKEADRRVMKTVAFPAIGTGAGRLPPKVLAEAMFQGVVSFSKGKVQNVKEVRILLFNNDVIPPFVSAIQALSDKNRLKKTGLPKILKGKADNSSSSEARLINTLHQVAKLYIYTADKNNVKRLLDDFGGVVTRKFMRKMDTAVNDPIPYTKSRESLPDMARSNDNFKVIHLPSTWIAQGTNEKVKIVSLQPSEDEYKEVVKCFKSTLGIRVKIISVQRIQNPTLYRLYAVKKEHIENQNSDMPGIQSEKTLWHGTTTSAIDNINHHGFNRSYCGKNATVYGEGVYFAVNSAYSANIQYSTPDTSGKRYIYQCKVLSGCPTKGDNTMKVPPSRSGVILYDSATDDLDTPKIYVIFNDHQAYPEYLITFEGLN